MSKDQDRAARIQALREQILASKVQKLQLPNAMMTRTPLAKVAGSPKGKEVRTVEAARSNLRNSMQDLASSIPRPTALLPKFRKEFLAAEVRKLKARGKSIKQLNIGELKLLNQQANLYAMKKLNATLELSQKAMPKKLKSFNEALKTAKMVRRLTASSGQQRTYTLPKQRKSQQQGRFS